MERVLVTGGAGYVGSHTCKALADAGYLPVTIDNLSRGHRWAVKWGPLEAGDIADRAFLDAVIARYRPAAAIHFAALSLVGESVSQPGLYYRNNVAGSLNLVEALCDGGVGRLIFSSTCAVYGIPDRLPIAEEAAKAPISPYGATKLVIERMLADFAPAHRLRSIALRYFNAAGAEDGAGIGEAHDPETHLVPIAVEVALGNLPVLEIFGADYPTPDGTCIRDYIHVADLADAHVRALAALERIDGHAAYNLGTGQGCSVREVIAAVEKVSGRMVAVRASSRRPGDPPVLVADAARARAALGWTPTRSSIETIAASAWRWRRDRHALATARGDAFGVAEGGVRGN